jgi:arylsulfatase A-like enzyme
MRSNNMHTALIGKAHFQPLASDPRWPSVEAYPTLQDYDHWRSFREPWYGFDDIELVRNHADEGHVGMHYGLWLNQRCPDWRTWFCRPGGSADGGRRGAWELPEELHYNRWIEERTVAKLEQVQASGRSSFTWASFPDPHPPYLVSGRWAEMYRPEDVEVPDGDRDDISRWPPYLARTREVQPSYADYREPEGHGMHGCHSHLHDRKQLAKDIAIYHGMMAFVDDCVGGILGSLDRLGMAQDTLVIFTTDHGHFFGQHGLIAKGPFHFEDMVRVPFLARLPGTIPAGTVSDALVSLIDVAPTMLSALDLEQDRSMSGVDQLGVWSGAQSSARDHVLVENRHQPHLLHVDTYVERRWKLTVHRGHTWGELYDLETDPGEHRNLWDDPAAQETKRDLLLRFVHAEMAKAPVPMPRIAGA